MLVNSCHFQKSGLRLPDVEPPTISSNPGSLGFPGCALLALVRPVPPTLAPSLQRSRSVPWPIVLDVQSCTPWCFSGPVMFFLYSAGGYRQISTVTRFQAHPSGFLHWARGPYSRAAGGSLLTGAVLKAHSAGGVSGSFGRSVLKPKLLAGWLSFVPSPTLLHKFQVTPKSPNFQDTVAPYRCPLSLQKSLIRSTSVTENLWGGRDSHGSGGAVLWVWWTGSTWTHVRRV